MHPQDHSSDATTESEADNARLVSPVSTAPQPEPSPTSSASEDRTDPATRSPLTLQTLAVELWHGFFRTNVTGQATQFAYSLIVAIFPLLVLVMSLGALVDSTLGVPVADNLQNLIERSAPEALKPLLLQLVEHAIAQTSAQTASVGAVVATLLAVIGASGAVGSMVGACARAYGVRSSRSIVVSRLVNALLAVVIIVLIVAAAVLLVFGEAIGERLTDRLSGGGGTDSLVTAVRWFLVVTCTLVALLALYRIGPGVDLEFRWLLPGAVIATGMWLLLLLGFSALLRVTNPGDPFGVFGSLVVLLWSFYLTGFVFMLGAVINAVVGNRFDERYRADLARHPERRLFCDDGREFG